MSLEGPKCSVGELTAFTTQRVFDFNKNGNFVNKQLTTRITAVVAWAMATIDTAYHLLFTALKAVTGAVHLTVGSLIDLDDKISENYRFDAMVREAKETLACALSFLSTPVLALSPTHWVSIQTGLGIWSQPRAPEEKKTRFQQGAELSKEIGHKVTFGYFRAPAAVKTVS